MQAAAPNPKLSALVCRDVVAVLAGQIVTEALDRGGEVTDVDLIRRGWSRRDLQRHGEAARALVGQLNAQDGDAAGAARQQALVRDINDVLNAMDGFIGIGMHIFGRFLQPENQPPAIRKMITAAQDGATRAGAKALAETAGIELCDDVATMERIVQFLDKAVQTRCLEGVGSKRYRTAITAVLTVLQGMAAGAPGVPRQVAADGSPVVALAVAGKILDQGSLSDFIAANVTFRGWDEAESQTIRETIEAGQVYRGTGWNGQPWTLTRVGVR